MKAVLFDAGGTLVFVDPALLASCARGAVAEEACAAAETAARADVARYFAGRAKGGVMPSTEAAESFRILIERIYEHAGLEGPAREEAVERVVSANEVLSVWRRPNPEAGPVLAALAERGVRLGVVSNSDGRVAEVLRATGFLDAFEFVVDSFHEGVEKPNPEIFRRALARLNLPGEEVAYVGDLPPVDLPGAEAVGIRGIVYDPGGHFAGSDFSRVERLERISKILFP